MRPRRIFDPASLLNFCFYISHGLTVECITSVMIPATPYGLRLIFNGLEYNIAEIAQGVLKISGKIFNERIAKASRD
jgi:hypothetical protein